MSDRARRRRLIRACSGASSLWLLRDQVRGVEGLLDNPIAPPRRRR